ncbi:MAG: hypothetical protein IT258_16605 [Saprospiraceae bacterium]|nr:hypothetical protein [Saprospiraceae bacterium]
MNNQIFNMVAFVDLLKNVPNFLKYGLLGVGALMALLAFYLIYTEQKRNNNPRKPILAATYAFMGFSVLILVLGIASKLGARTNAESEDITNGEPTPAEEYDRAYKNFQHNQIIPNVKQEITFYRDQELWDFINVNQHLISEMYISGAHLQNGVGRIKSNISSILSENGTVHVVTTNPYDTVSIQQNANRNEPAHFFNVVQGHIMTSLSDLANVRNHVASGTLDVKTIKMTLDERIHAIKFKNGPGRIYVKIYPYKHKDQMGVEFGGCYFYLTENKPKEKIMYDYYLEKAMNYAKFGEIYDLDKHLLRL